MNLSESNKVLEVALTQDITLDKEAAKKITKAKEVWVSHYSQNPKDFIESYVKILHGSTNDECDFILNDAQCALVEAMEDNRFVAAPKARQLGITTLTCLLYTSPSPRDS